MAVQNARAGPPRADNKGHFGSRSIVPPASSCSTGMTPCWKG